MYKNMFSYCTTYKFGYPGEEFCCLRIVISECGINKWMKHLNMRANPFVPIYL